MTRETKGKDWNRQRDAIEWVKGLLSQTDEMPCPSTAGARSRDVDFHSDPVTPGWPIPSVVDLRHLRQLDSFMIIDHNQIAYISTVKQ
jgi:hypothetical protein